MSGETVEAEGEVVALDELLRRLNQDIAEKVGNDHQIGHSYLMTVAKADSDDRVDMLAFVWNNQILPLLEEYFYSDRETLAQVLQSFRTDIDEDIDPYNIGRADGENLVAALAAMLRG